MDSKNLDDRLRLAEKLELQNRPRARASHIFFIKPCKFTNIRNDLEGFCDKLEMECSMAL